MRAKKHKILMVCDNCAIHRGDMQSVNIKLVFLPSNKMSLIQPMNHGKIASFKWYYRSSALHVTWIT